MTDKSPVMTRVGGRFSARAAVLVVGVTLASIVGAALVNRPPAPRPAAQVLVPPSVMSTQSSATPAPSPTVTVTTPPCPDLSTECEPASPARVQIDAADVIVGLPVWPARAAR